MNYNSNQFHNIDSKDFGGYWVGNFTYEKEEQMQISISQSWAKTRIIIDDMIIYEGGTNEQIPYTFRKGKHKIEVEYVNNWHTVSFKVSIKNKEKVFTSNEIKKELNEHTSKNSEVVFVGAWQCLQRDRDFRRSLELHRPGCWPLEACRQWDKSWCLALLRRWYWVEQEADCPQREVTRWCASVQYLESLDYLKRF